MLLNGKNINKNNVFKVLICSDGLSNEFGLPTLDFFDKEYLEKMLKNCKNHDDLSYYLIENVDLSS